jgi:hypothetical protein
MIRIALILLVLAAPLSARAAEDEAFGHALTLVETLVRLGIQPNPEQGIADVLAGRNEKANRALSGLLEGASSEVPPEYRDRVASLGRDLAAYVAKHPASAALIDSVDTQRSLQARKDLNAMGLRYFDEKQFLEAVGRNDALAVELFIAGRGVNLASRDERGRNASEIARANGNAQLAELLSRTRP